MSEMSEVNHGMPSLNGVNPLAGVVDGVENGTSPSLKTTIPMQEVSAVREEPLSAATHTSHTNDWSTAAAASQPIISRDNGMPVVQPAPEVQGEAARAVVEGPGHEAESRDPLGSHMAETEGQSGNGSAPLSQQPPTFAASAPINAHPLFEPVSESAPSQSDEASLGVSQPTQSDSTLATPANSFAQQSQPPLASTLQEQDPALSPVKPEEVVAPAAELPLISAVEEQAASGDTKAALEIPPVVQDTAPANGEAPVILSSQGMSAPTASLSEGTADPASSYGEEPPSKRQRKSVSLGFDAGESATSALAGPESTRMTPAQIKFCQNAVKALRGRPEAGPFLAPVDPVALNIPHYPNIIQEPMDLGTIDIRLALTAAAAKGGSKPTEKTKQAAKWNLDPVRDVYADVNAFERDVRLVFGNCVRFNGPDHILSQNAKNLEAVFAKQLKTLPVQTPTAAEHDASAFEASSPSVNNGTRRPSDVASRPKRDIHPPAPKDLPWTDRPQSAGAGAKRKKPKRPMTAREEAKYMQVTKDQLKFVRRVVDDMHTPPFSAFAWVFFEKPSMDMDFAPSYYNIIKKPISLKEIKEKLKRGDYESVEGTKKDMDLMLNNCFLYNETGSDVWKMGMEVKKAWEAQLDLMPQHPAEEEDDDEEDDDEDDGNLAQAKMIRDEIAALQAKLEGLTGSSKAVGAKMLASAKASLAAMPGKKTGKKRRPSESSGSTKKAGMAKKPKTPSAGPSGFPGSGFSEARKPKPKKPSEGKKRDEDVRDVTYEQKEELAAKITQLPDDRLDGALKIIAEDKPPNANDDEEIELDIDDLSPQTLYKLYRYVVRPKGKKAPSKVSASDGRKRGTGGVKRKNLDEGEEAARIARLQEQLQQFDNPESGASSTQGAGAAASRAGAHDDLVASESSSGEEDSDSESEFE